MRHLDIDKLNTFKPTFFETWDEFQYNKDKVLDLLVNIKFLYNENKLNLINYVLINDELMIFDGLMGISCETCQFIDMQNSNEFNFYIIYLYVIDMDNIARKVPVFTKSSDVVDNFIELMHNKTKMSQIAQLN